MLDFAFFFSTLKRSTTSDDTITVFVDSLRSLSKYIHLHDIKNEDRITNNDNMGFKEIQINPSVSTSKLI